MVKEYCTYFKADTGSNQASRSITRIIAICNLLSACNVDTATKDANTSTKQVSTEVDQNKHKRYSLYYKYRKSSGYNRERAQQLYP